MDERIIQTTMATVEKPEVYEYRPISPTSCLCHLLEQKEDLIGSTEDLIGLSKVVVCVGIRVQTVFPANLPSCCFH